MMGSCSMLSAVWFKPEHRATATAVAYMGGKQAIHYLSVQEREGGSTTFSFLGVDVLTGGLDSFLEVHNTFFFRFFILVSFFHYYGTPTASMDG